MKLMSFVAFLFFVVGLVLAVLSLWFDGRSGRHRAMAISGVLLSWSALCMVFVYGSDKGADALLWYQLSLPGILFLIPANYWIYLDQAQFRPWTKWVCVGAVAGFGVVLYGLYSCSGFLFSDFRPGPWGNVGIVSNSPFWYFLGSTVYLVTHSAVVILMFRCRAAARSTRLRRLYGANAIGLILTAVLFGIAWTVETHGWPPMDLAATGFYLIGVNFFLMGRYRYLQRDPVLDVGQVGGHLSEALFVLDGALRVKTANHAAQTLLGREETTLKGASFPELFDHAESLKSRWESSLLRTDAPVSFQGCRNGRLFETNLAPHFDRFGDISGAVAVVRARSTAKPIGTDSGLTARELEILDLILQGFGNKTIASTLFISTGTVKNHIYSIYKKAGVESRLELMNKFRTAVLN